MIHQIYILCVLAITVIILVYYYTLEVDHRKELEKIDRMELLNKREHREMELIRSQSSPCPVGNFTNPRACYYDSGYMCTWNDVARRCDLKQ